MIIATSPLAPPVTFCHLDRYLDQHFSNCPGFIDVEFEIAQTGHCEHNLVPFVEYPHASFRTLVPEMPMRRLGV
jgi:hypothetical protein